MFGKMDGVEIPNSAYIFCNFSDNVEEFSDCLGCMEHNYLLDMCVCDFLSSSKRLGGTVP